MPQAEIDLDRSNEIIKYSAAQMGEFLEACETREIELDFIDDEYTAHSDTTGLLCAYFNAVPIHGPAGGWIIV